MSVTVRSSRNFRKEVKLLLKSYVSLPKDLLLLEKELLEKPGTGISLCYNPYKIRLKIKSKGKAKSGGARVISLVETIPLQQPTGTNGTTDVILLSIYDKADADTISDAELKRLIKNFMQGR